ncbi:MAG: hypothetical protein MUF07_15610 [Steroidobacteraceae bacterium]|jgi:hypothetical protein|nr:hypothetical protein [Steroidobacteraceae bacterium]
MASDSRCSLALVAAGWLGLAAGLVAPAAAEPVAAPGDETKAARLKLAAKRGEPGQWARAEARLAADGERRYYIGGANVSAPLSIQVIAERRDVPIQVSLHRQSWAVVEAEGTTGAAGLYRFEGRAYGDVGIRLRAAGDRATRATVLVWQGEPVPPPLQAVYAPPDSARVAAAMAAGGVATRPASAGATTAASGAGAATGAGGAAPAAAGGTSPVMLAILGALVVIAGLLAVLVFRRGGAKAATALAALSLALAFAATPGPARAQAPDPFEVPKELQKPPLDADKTPRGPKSAEPKPKDDVKSKDDAKPAEADRRAGRAEDARGSDVPKDPFRPSDAPKDGDGDGDGGGGGDGSGSYRERIEAAEQSARDLATQVAATRAELERLRMLLESDRDNETDPDRFPPMPISCRPPRFAGGDGVMTPSQSEAIDAAWENYEECTQCYREPLADFERQLELYERLRVLYSDTSKFVTKVIAVGDQAAKPHYLLENAWAAQKTKIRVDFAKTQAAYDAKLEEFNGRLSEILDRIGACETELNDNPMWRKTSGTFFYHATVNAYRRTD